MNTHTHTEHASVVTVVFVWGALCPLADALRIEHLTRTSERVSECADTSVGCLLARIVKRVLLHAVCNIQARLVSPWVPAAC